MHWFLGTIFLNQRQHGPTLNLTAVVLSGEGDVDKVRDPESDTLKTEIITVDDKVEFFFKFKWFEVDDNSDRFEMYIIAKKKESVENSSVGVNITCNNIKKNFQCTNDWIEVSINTKGQRRFYLYPGRCDHLSDSTYTFLYNFEITITVKEVSLSMNNKLYEDTDFTDFELQASDGSVAIHKAMMSVHSDMFKTMLRGEWKETAEGRINIDGVTVQTLRHLKDYMYLGNLPETFSSLKTLLLLAEHYLMDKLKSDCIDKLVTSLEPENFEDILQFACQGSPFTELVRALIFQVPDHIRNSAQKKQ